MICKSYRCKKSIPDGSRFCNFCGWDHDPKSPNVLICKHCKGVGECNRGKTVGIKHSCEYCVKKAGVQLDDMFSKVPCAYCEGTGYQPVINKPQAQGQQKRQNWKKGGRR
ncbi:hypothetical protein KKE75_04930 [Patescibacteria group bacterium]|nr:hypothetical protein [Patescibacteria group bacterium]